MPATPHTTYQPARSVAAILDEHFRQQLAEASFQASAALATAPDASIIETIIDRTFWASLRREEGHFPKISLAFVSPEQAAQPLMLEHPLPLTPDILTKLAPAVERPGIHLGIWGDAHHLQIWGTTRTIPDFCFVTEVVEPGMLVIKQRSMQGVGKFRNIAVFKGGQVNLVDEQSALLPDCPELLVSLLGFRQTAQKKQAVNIFVQLAASMRAHGRGGALLVVPANTNGWRKSIIHPIKYAVAPAFSELTTLVRQSPEEQKQLQWLASLNRAVESMAGLTAIDGATVISEQYELLAFGAKIGRSEGSLPVERIMTTEPLIGSEAKIIHPAQNGGTRHLSAAQFVHDQRNAMALVASQDGRFTIFSWSPCEDMVQAHRIDMLLL